MSAIPLSIFPTQAKAGNTRQSEQETNSKPRNRTIEKSILPPTRKSVKMPNFNWTTENVQYVVSQFDAKVPPAKILTHLQSSGYDTVQRTNIEQCLRANGRVLDGSDPRASHSCITETFDAGNFKGKSTSLARNSPVIVDNQGSEAASRPQSYQRRRWDSAADKYVMNAHHDGRSVVDIWGDLRRDGYDVKLSGVAVSLNSQGVEIVKVTDYLVS